MKKFLKLYFLSFIFLLAFSFFNLARAETVPAISYFKAVSSSYHFSSPQQLCASMVSRGVWDGAPVPPVGSYAVWCYSSHYNQNYNLGIRLFKCPDDSYTLNSDSVTCSRPECPAGSTRDESGVCSAPCPDGQFKCNGQCVPNCSPTQQRDDSQPGCCGCSTFNNAAYPSSVSFESAGGAAPSEICFHGCQFSGGSFGMGLPSQNLYVSDLGSPLGQKCSVPDSEITTKGGFIEMQGEIKEPSPQSPKCQENVITRSDGSIVCVPAAVPVSVKPETTIRKKTEVNPLGEQTVTEVVTTRDPTTGALTVQTVVTGPSGQSSSSESESSENKKSGDGDCTGDDCTEGGNDPLGAQGSFGDASGDIEEAKGRLMAEWNLIKEQASGMFTAPGAGSGALPCPPPVNVLGADFSLCLTDYSEQLAIIGLAFIAVCYVVAAMVLLRS